MRFADWKKQIANEYRAEYGRNADLDELWHLAAVCGVDLRGEHKAGTKWQDVYHRLVAISFNV